MTKFTHLRLTSNSIYNYKILNCRVTAEEFAYKKLSYHKQIARQRCAHNTSMASSNSVTLKSRLEVNQGH